MVASKAWTAPPKRGTRHVKSRSDSFEMRYVPVVFQAARRARARRARRYPSTPSRLALASLALLAASCSKGHAQADPPVSTASGKARGSTLPSARPARASAPTPSSSAAAAPEETKAAKPAQPSGPRVYAKSRFVWIREYPNADMQWIGFLWTGGSVALRSEQVYYGPGCEHWYAIEPVGFVCVDGKRATLDPKDPVLVALEPHAPRLDTAWPHVYGESLGVDRYTALPPLPETGDAPPARLQPVSASVGVQSDQPGLGRLSEDPFAGLTLPGTVFEGRPRLLPRSTVAYSSELVRSDRTYLLTADMTWVAKDRVTPYEHVTFKGVELGKQFKLPVAFFRGTDRPQYVKTADGNFEPNGKTFPRLSHVQLTGDPVESGDDVFIAVAGGTDSAHTVFVKKSEAVIPEPQALTPWGTKVGSDDTTGHPAGRATWLEASVWGGWLLAYEGNRPVYATMISPGRGGTPVPGKDPLVTASTPTGSFPISGKFATATMEAPGEYIHSDVPWTQNFSGPHALHGAYWHNDWGKLKSAGCVNVSPLDGRWLFEFTEPTVPPGWHAVRWLPSKGPATVFVIHR